MPSVVRTGNDWARLATEVGLRTAESPSEQDLKKASLRLGNSLSAGLTDLYRETDGLFDQHGYALCDADRRAG